MSECAPAEILAMPLPDAMPVLNEAGTRASRGVPAPWVHGTAGR